MQAAEISGQWYVVRWTNKSKLQFNVIDGPYPKECQAISVARLKETWD